MEERKPSCRTGGSVVKSKWYVFERSVGVVFVGSCREEDEI